MESCVKLFMQAMSDIIYEDLECREMPEVWNATVYKLNSQRDPRDLNFI